MGEALIDYGDREVCGGVWGGGGVEEMGEALIDYGDRECAEVSGCVDAARGGAYFVPAVRRASGRLRLGAANARCGLVDQGCARAASARLCTATSTPRGGRPGRPGDKHTSVPPSPIIGVGPGGGPWALLSAGYIDNEALGLWGTEKASRCGVEVWRDGTQDLGKLIFPNIPDGKPVYKAGRGGL